MPKPPTANHKLNLDNVTASLKLLAENSDLKSDVIVKTSTSTKTQTETEILSPESKKTSGVLSVKEGLGKITSASSFDKKDQDFLSLAEDINNYLTDITSALQIMQDHEVNVKEDGISGQLAKITSLGIELGRSVQPQESRSSYAKNMVEDKEVFLNDPFSGGDVSALSLVAPQEAPIDLDNSQELEDKDDDNGSLSLLDVSHDSISKSESEAQSAVNNEALEEKQSDKNSDNFFIDEDLEYAPDEAEQKNKLKSEIIAKAQEIKFSNEGLNTQDDFSLKHIKSENSFTDHGAACEYTLKTIESDPFDDESPLNCKDIIFSDSDFGCKLIIPKGKNYSNTKLLKETSKEEILNFALEQIQKVAIDKRTLYFKEQDVYKKGNDAANLPVSENNDLSDKHGQQILLNEADEVENQQVDSEISVDDSEIDYTDMPLDNSQDMLFYADVEEAVVNEIQDGNPAKVSKQQVQNAYQQSFQNQLSFKGKRLLEPNDFLDEVAKIDPWYQTILKAGYSSGPDFAALLYTIRKQNEADPNKWIIYISDDFKLLATDPTWKHNLVTKFSISNSKPVDIDIELTSQAPEGCPYLQACALFIKQLNATRNALLSNRKLTELLNDLGEDLYKMRIDLYTDVH